MVQFFLCFPHIDYAETPTDVASHGIKSEQKDTGDRMKKKDEHMSLEVLNNAITILLNWYNKHIIQHSFNEID